MIQLSPLTPANASPTGARPTGEPSEGDRFAALMPGKRQAAGNPLPLPTLEPNTEANVFVTSLDAEAGPDDGDDPSAEPLFTKAMVLPAASWPQATVAAASIGLTSPSASPLRGDASPLTIGDGAPGQQPLFPGQAAADAPPPTLDGTEFERAGNPLPPVRTDHPGALPESGSDNPVPASLIPRTVPASPSSATPTRPEAAASLHPQDSAKLAAALASAPFAFASKARAPSTRTADPLGSETTPPLPATAPTLPVTPVPPAASTAGRPGDQPSTPNPERSGEALGQMLEHVEFGRAETGGDATHLRVVHEAVGRLGITAESAGEGIDLRLRSDDAAVRHALAEAVPGLMRLADNRHLEISSVGIGPLVDGGRDEARGNGRDSPPRRHDVRSPNRSRSPDTAPRSTGLFA